MSIYSLASGILFALPAFFLPCAFSFKMILLALHLSVYRRDQVFQAI